MSPSLPVPLVTVSGTPAECGEAYGAATADRVRKSIDGYGRRFATESGLDGTAVRRAGEAFRAATREHHPRIAQQLDGMAGGAGVEPALIYALNARTELLYGTDDGCTAIGVLGTHTASGHLLVGQNWDWHPDQRDAMVLLQSTDERGHAVLALTEVGMLAKTGLNSAGVGVCVNMLNCTLDGFGGGRPVGVPYHVLLRAVLDADSIGWAARSTFRSPRNASINLLVGEAGEHGGELIDLELVPGDAGWLHPVDGLLTHANHFEAALQIFDSFKEWGGSSLFRSARARRLLAEAAADRKVTEDDLIGVFRDHASFPIGICRHVDERMEPRDHSESIYSVLLDLDARRLAVAAGPPCGHEYVWLDLAG